MGGGLAGYIPGSLLLLITAYCMSEYTSNHGDLNGSASVIRRFFPFGQQLTSNSRFLLLIRSSNNEPSIV